MSIRIITACSRPENLKQLYDSIRFEMIHAWYIVYDTSKAKCTKQFANNQKVVELECNTKGVCGHPQINHALNIITEGYIYVLDDDNIMHPNFWTIVPQFDGENVYTFDQIRMPGDKLLLGNSITYGYIDTAQFVVPRHRVSTVRWPEQMRGGDYAFISAIKRNNPHNFKYIPGVASYWNYIPSITYYWNYIPKPVVKSRLPPMAQKVLSKR